MDLNSKEGHPCNLSSSKRYITADYSATQKKIGEKISSNLPTIFWTVGNTEQLYLFSLKESFAATKVYRIPPLSFHSILPNSSTKENAHISGQ